MRSILQVAVVALLIALPAGTLPMPSAIDTPVPRAAHGPSSSHGPATDKNQAHAAQPANGAQAAENAINQILQNRLKSICRGC
jgi:hypothetical protein